MCCVFFAVRIVLLNFIRIHAVLQRGATGETWRPWKQNTVGTHTQPLHRPIYLWLMIFHFLIDVWQIPRLLRQASHIEFV